MRRTDASSKPQSVIEYVKPIEQLKNINHVIGTGVSIVGMIPNPTVVLNAALEIPISI